MEKTTYYINGMHCSACETFIERTVKNLKGIHRARVSLHQSSILIEARSSQVLPSISQLNNLFSKDGYSFTETREEARLKLQKWLAVLGIFILVVVLFFLLERSHLLSFLYVDTESNLIAYLLLGITAGFSSCAALVGSLLLSVQGRWVNQDASSAKRRSLPFMLFNGARLISFAFLGGLLGMLGGIVQFSLEASTVLTIGISVLIFIVGMQMLGVKCFQRILINFSGRWINRVTSKPDLHEKVMPILFGVITFFIPCGFTLIAQSQALRSGNFIDGVTILLAFALGTLPVLLFISFSSIKFNRNPRFASSFRMLSGLLIVFFAVYTIGSQINILNPTVLWRGNIPDTASPADSLNGDQRDLAGEIQLMQMEAKGFDYFPEKITIKANTPTRFEIFSNESLGCANAVYARGLYPNVIFLNPGLNVVEFTSPASGTYEISCSMWMVTPITVVVE